MDCCPVIIFMCATADYGPLTARSSIPLTPQGGILVSALLKYTTAMLKNFAAPIGIILNWFISKYVLQSTSAKPNRYFILGTTLVLLALGLFSSSA